MTEETPKSDIDTLKASKMHLIKPIVNKFEENKAQFEEILRKTQAKIKRKIHLVSIDGPDHNSKTISTPVIDKKKDEILIAQS